MPQNFWWGTVPRRFALLAPGRLGGSPYPLGAGLKIFGGGARATFWGIQGQTLARKVLTTAIDSSELKELIWCWVWYSLTLLMFKEMVVRWDSERCFGFNLRSALTVFGNPTPSYLNSWINSWSSWITPSYDELNWILSKIYELNVNFQGLVHFVHFAALRVSARAATRPLALL